MGTEVEAVYKRIRTRRARRIETGLERELRGTDGHRDLLTGSQPDKDDLNFMMDRVPVGAGLLSMTK